jgi:hypothetical protein
MQKKNKTDIGRASYGTSARKLTGNSAETYCSEEALEELMLVNEAMDRRFLPRCRGCQRVDPKCSQASGTKVPWHQRIVRCAVLYESLYEVLREATEALEPCLCQESVV